MLDNKVFVIFGGYGGPEGHTKFNEINLLHLDTMVWSQPQVTGCCPPGMYAHASAAIGNKLIVYGGDIGAPTRLLSSDLYIFDLCKYNLTYLVNLILNSYLSSYFTLDKSRDIW